MSQTVGEKPRRHRLTVDDYYRMAEAGILARDARVELIEGEIIDMAPIGSRHAAMVDQLVEILREAVRDMAIVRCQNPVSLGNYSEPEPDVALLRRRADFYRARHPEPDDILLLIEVADSSLPYDRDVKLPLYARHGIREVWIIDVADKTLSRYRGPVGDSYSRVDQPYVGQALDIDPLPNVAIHLAAALAD